MTPVLVATEQEGVARVYFRNSDGALTQTAQMLVGTVAPTELAATAADMNDRFRWDRVITQRKAAAEALPTATTPVRKQRAPSSDRLKRTAAQIAEYDAAVLGVITRQPWITINEIALVASGEINKRTTNNVRAALDRIQKATTLKLHRGDGPHDPMRYAMEGADEYNAA